MTNSVDSDLVACTIALIESHATRDIILISAGISRQLHYDLSQLIAREQKHQECVVFLATRGGEADGGYRIARCLQHHYSDIRLVIPSLCKSAGTLIAIGADQMAIGDLGELGPLDVQVRKSSELEQRSSSLDIIQALEVGQAHVRKVFLDTLVEITRSTRLATKLAGEFAVSIAVGVAAPLYSQIDPNRLGELQRAIKIAQEYGQRLNDRSNALRNGALRKIVAGYPSHGFVIDRKEAADLFKSVQHPTNEEANFYHMFWRILADQTDFGPVFVREDALTILGGVK